MLPKLLSRPENLGKIAFRLAMPLACPSFQRYLDQGQCCLARDDPAQDGRLQAMRTYMNEAASDAAKAAQSPQIPLPGSAHNCHTTGMPQLPAAMRSVAMLPWLEINLLRDKRYYFRSWHGLPNKDLQHTSWLRYASWLHLDLLMSCFMRQQHTHKTSTLPSARQATKASRFLMLSQGVRHAL